MTLEQEFAIGHTCKNATKWMKDFKSKMNPEKVAELEHLELMFIATKQNRVMLKSQGLMVDQKKLQKNITFFEQIKIITNLQYAEMVAHHL